MKRDKSRGEKRGALFGKKGLSKQNFFIWFIALGVFSLLIAGGVLFLFGFNTEQISYSPDSDEELENSAEERYSPSCEEGFFLVDDKEVSDGGDVSWNTGKEACCSSKSYLVDYNGKCVLGTTLRNSTVFTGFTTKDKIAFPYAGNVDGTFYIGWMDCDFGNFANAGNYCGESICTGGKIQAGESEVGEYSDTSSVGCCGDDANEFAITGNGFVKCCNSHHDCLDSSGNCVDNCGKNSDFYCSNLLGQAKTFCEAYSHIEKEHLNANYEKIIDSFNNYESYIQRSYLNLYLATKNTYYLDLASKSFNNTLKLRDDNIGKKDFSGESKAGWSSNDYTDNGENYRYILHDGEIIYPMLKFAEIIYLNSSLKSNSLYKSLADYYIAESEKVVAAQNYRWKSGPDDTAESDEGYYFYSSSDPQSSMSGYNLPHNQQLAMGQSLIILYNLTEKEEYSDKVRRMGRFFQRDLEEDENNAYIWHYWNGILAPNSPNYTWYEDMSHAPIDIVFISEAYKHGFNIGTSSSQFPTSEDMEKFANTFIKNIFISTSNFADKVDGSEDSSGKGQADYSGSWLDLANFDLGVYDIVKQTFSDNNFETSTYVYVMQGYAYLTYLASKMHDGCEYSFLASNKEVFFGGNISWNGVEKISCCEKNSSLLNYNNNCVLGTTVHNSTVSTGSSEKDKYAFPYASSNSSGWLDCDAFSNENYYANSYCASLCKQKYLAGELNTGEYNSTSIYGCCGDDANEYLKTNAQTKTSKCCNSASDILNSTGSCSIFEEEDPEEELPSEEDSSEDTEDVEDINEINEDNDLDNSDFSVEDSKQSIFENFWFWFVLVLVIILIVLIILIIMLKSKGVLFFAKKEQQPTQAQEGFYSN